MGALAQTQMTQLLDQIQKGVREVHLTVSWKEGKATESIDVVTDVVLAASRFRPQRTPGAPLRQQHHRVPGVPQLPPGQGAFPRRNPRRLTGAPNRGNTPPGAQLDPFGRPIRSVKPARGFTLLEVVYRRGGHAR